MSEVQPLNVSNALVAVGNGVLNEVSPLPCHALLKFTPVASVPSFASAGNDVSAVVPCHAAVKFTQLGACIAGKLCKLVSNCHASLKSPALSVLSKGKLVSDEQPRQALK